MTARAIARHPPVAALCAVLCVALATAALPVMAAATEHDEIVVETMALRPPILRTTVERRVTFVNRSGRVVHVDFVGDQDRHHVVQVPGSIWAIFHRTGSHPYVVHIESGHRHELKGVVEVVDDPSPGEPRVCDTVTVMGVCIEP